MVHRSLSYSLLVLLLAAPACDEPTGRTDGQVPTLEAPGDDDRAAGSSPCTTGWTSIDCHAQALTLDVDGLDRDVLWQVPAGSPPPGGWPVVLAFHGTNDPPGKMFYWSYYSAIDQAFGGYYQLKTVQGLLEAGFAVIAPRGRTMVGGIYWDTNIAPYASSWESGPDAAFVDRILAEAEAGTFGSLDTTRWYATGLSSGAYMSSRMAIAYPDKVRAVALQSGSYATCLSSLPCLVSAADLPADHPPTLLMAGYWDGIVPLYTIESYEEALDDNGTEATLEVVGYASHQWTSYSPGWVLEWFQTH
ncbi:MAG: hypothetical protein KDK70_00420 [Myxococcales bacterium]|nr:hypothetical protein [Myxococcales bacterium]